MLYALLLAITTLTVPGAAFGGPPPKQFWKACESGSGAGQCLIPRGISSSPVDGTVYIADQVNNRVVALSAWGEFIRTFGWRVNRTKVEAGASESQQNICPIDPGDVCQAGSAGTGSGQFSGIESQTSPQGVAVDSTGSVYAVDVPNRRVQKFDSEGHFLLMFGGDVNKTKVEVAAPVAQRNICPIDPGDVCQAGTEGTGPGQFGSWPVLGSYIAIDTKSTAAVTDDVIYLGDVGRIQKFDSSGAFKGNLPNPQGVLTGKTVTSLAVVPAGSGAADAGELFVAFRSTLTQEAIPEVFRLFAGERVCNTEGVATPRAVATDPAGNVYVVDGASNPQIRKFGPFCEEIIDANFPFEDGFDGSTGLGTGAACLSKGADLYVSNSDFFNSFVRAYGPEPDKASPPACLADANPPEILAEYAIKVGTDSATLRATINPRQWKDTTYFAQYATTACIEAGNWEAACVNVKPVPPALLGGGAVNEGVSTAGILVEDLLPGTEYRFRFVSQSGGGGPVTGGESKFTTYRPLTLRPCANDPFRFGSSAVLPDCRAYEMVSPVDKNGGDIIAAAGIELEREAAFRQAAVDGNKLTYTSTTAFGDAVRGSVANQYMATRGPSGWTSHGLNPPQGTTVFDPGFNTQFDLNTNFQAFTPDLCFALLRDQNLTPLAAGGIAGYPNLYLRDNCAAEADTYKAITVGDAPTNSEEGLGLQARAFSRDLNHLVFTALATLESSPAAAEKAILQLYDSSGGQLHLVSVLPNGQPSEKHAFLGSAEPGEGGGSAARDSNLSRAVSEDGSRIYWTSDDKIYVRIDAAKTVQVSGAGSAEFWTADPQGTTAIYSEGGKLFSFDVESETSTEIAQKVGGVVGGSEDLSHLYFTSREAIADSGQNSEGAEAQAGEWNIYLDEEGTKRFIATVAAIDRVSPALDGYLPFAHSSRVTPDGEGMTFMSIRPLTGFDNADAETEEATSEVFVYDAGTEQLACASCNPAGARPEGQILPGAYSKSHPTTIRAAAWIPTWEWTSHANRSLSSDGERLFFNSFDRLVPGDTNGAQDVYQWEAPGRGGCRVGDPNYFPANAGCLDLISTGKSAQGSTFIDASVNGSDVFLSTASNIDPRDLGFIDIYDAREGGGFPPPAEPPPACEGDACQSVPTPPSIQTPASAAFKGPGNERARPGARKCRKGQRKVRRKGKVRCLPKRHRKANRNRGAGR